MARYNVYLKYNVNADSGAQGAQRVLRILLREAAQSFQPVVEKCVGFIDLDTPVEMDDVAVFNLLRSNCPNAIGMRLEKVSILTPELLEAFAKATPAPEDAPVP